MAVKILKTSANINAANAFYTSTASALISSTSTGWTSSLTSLASAQQIAVTYSSNHNTKGVMIPFQNSSVTNDRSILVELQQNIATVWTTQRSITLTPSQIKAVTNSSDRGLYLVDVEWSSVLAVTTAANTWRYQLTQTGGTIGTWNLCSSAYIEYTDTLASLSSGDTIAVAQCTLTINASTTIGDLYIGTNGQVSCTTNSVTLTTGTFVVPCANSRFFLGSSGSPVSGFKFSPTGGIAFLMSGVGSSLTTFGGAGKQVIKWYGSKPTTQRATVYQSKTVGATSFETVDDVSGWQNGWRFCFSHQSTKGSNDATIYTVNGSPTFSAGRYTVNFTASLAANIDVVTNHNARAILLDGYGITVDGGSGITYNSMIGQTAMIFNGVSFIKTNQINSTLASSPTLFDPSFGDTSNSGSSSYEGCVVYGSGMLPITASPYGFFIKDTSLIYGGGNAFTFTSYLTAFGTVQLLQRWLVDGLYMCGVSGQISQTESSISNVYVSNGAGVTFSGSAIALASNIRVYGTSGATSAGVSFADFISEAISSVYIDNCANGMTVTGASLRNTIANLVLGSNNTADILWTTATLVDIKISQVNKVFSVTGTQSGILDGSWIRATNYATTGDFASFSRNGYFLCQSDTKMKAVSNQSSFSNVVPYRISSTTINGANIYISVNCQIQNSAFYAGTYTLPSLSTTHDGTSTTSSASASTSLQTLSNSFTAASDNQEFVFSIAQKTDAGVTNGDVVWSAFVCNVRKYGSVYQTYSKLIQYTTADIFQNITPLVTNTFITQPTMATVAAYSGISLNYSTKTITITSNHSISEIYDYTQYSAQANMDKTEWMTTFDGSIFNLSDWNFVVTNCTVSGTGKSFTTTGTVTLNGTGAITLDSYTDSAGKHVSLTLTGLITGTEIYVYKSSDSSVLASNTSISGAIFTYNYTWTTDITAFITIIKLGYIWQRIDGINLSSSTQSIPIQQTVDRSYSNP